MLKTEQTNYRSSPNRTTSYFSSSTIFPSTKQQSGKIKYPLCQTYYSQSQPKLQNKKLKYSKITVNQSFFNHLHNNKIVQSQQLLDQSFVKFLDNVQNKCKGFRGAKTHSWNQLMYLTPQKRHKSQNQQLQSIKKQLYEIIKPTKQETNPNINQNIQQQKNPIRNTLIQFLTQYNPKHDTVNLKPTQKICPYRYKRKSTNVIRQKLKSYNQKSEYKTKLHNYQMLFEGYKIP